jgi:hypothetical protein
MAYSSWLIRIAKRLDNRNLDNEEDGCFSTETVCATKNNENDEEEVDVDSGALSLVRILGYYCDAAMLVTLSIPDVPAVTCCITQSLDEFEKQRPALSLFSAACFFGRKIQPYSTHWCKER